MHREPPLSKSPSYRRLAAALAAALLSTSALQAAAQTSVADAWPRLREERGWPLLGELAARPRHRAALAPAGAVRVVTTCADDGPGSLRDAMVNAGEADTIDLTQLQCGHITLDTGSIATHVDNLTVRGAGADRTVVDGGGKDRVFIHFGLGTLTLQDLTVSGGYHHATGNKVAFGGCVAANSYLSIERSVVRDCKAVGVGAYGGATLSYALILRNSTITGNRASGRRDDATTAGFGGGVYAYVVDLEDSTITGNRADYQADPRFNSYGIGGGVMSVHGGSVRNSTIDSNFSQGRGGGIAVFDDLSITSSTISGNLAQAEVGGGAFLRWPSRLQLDNTTIAFNHGGSDAGGIWLNAPGSSFHSSLVFANSIDKTPPLAAGHDVGNQMNPYSTGLAQTIDGDHNLVGGLGATLSLPADTLHADPLLAPLASNGGPTRTHALRAGSPAIDAGANPNGLDFDQRGQARVYGKAADIGAYEVQAMPRAPEAKPVPTLSGRALPLLAALLGLLAASGLRRAGRD